MGQIKVLQVHIAKKRPRGHNHVRVLDKGKTNLRIPEFRPCKKTDPDPTGSATEQNMIRICISLPFEK